MSDILKGLAVKTAKERIASVRANKEELTALKKAAIKNTDAFAGPLVIIAGKPTEAAIKAVSPSAGSTDTETVIERTIIGNTYLWMDSHDDVHLPGVFSKSIQEQKKIFHLHDHLFQIAAQVGKAQLIEERAIDWMRLGVQKDGQTSALFMRSRIEKRMNPSVFEDYVSGEIQQHSVGMYYVKLGWAVNDPEDKEGFALWEMYLPKLGNPERALERGYMCLVYEAKLREISCVLAGSNELTGTIDEDSSTQMGKDDTATDSTGKGAADATPTTAAKGAFSSLGSKLKSI